MLPRIGKKLEYTLNQEVFSKLPKEVLMKMEEILDILDSAYGEMRNVMTDLGGFVQVLQSPSQWKQFLEYNSIDKEMYEFVEDINGQYIYLLYLKSDDYSIAVITPKDIIDIELRYE